MKVKVLYFASAREATEKTGEVLELPEGSTTAALVELLEKNYWRLSFKESKISIAINKTYCREETELKDGDEIALIPPISGG